MVPALLNAAACMTLLWIMFMVGEFKQCIWWAIFISNAEEPLKQSCTYQQLACHRSDTDFHEEADSDIEKEHTVFSHALMPMDSPVQLSQRHTSVLPGLSLKNLLTTGTPHALSARELSARPSESEFSDASRSTSTSFLLERPNANNAAEVVIVALTPGLKMVALILVPFVRLILAMFLMVAGIKFMFVQTSLQNSVLKCMTLRFVMTVDEVLIQGLSTKYSNRILRNCKFSSPGARTTCGTGNSRTYIAKHWENIGGVLLVFVSVVLWLLVYWGLFGGEYFFRQACLEYHDAFPGAFGVKETYTLKYAFSLLFAQ